MMLLMLIFAALAGTHGGIAHTCYKRKIYARAFVFCFLSGMFFAASMAVIYIEVFYC
jgi:hypothetical protein